MASVRVPSIYICAFIIAATLMDAALMAAVPASAEPMRNLIVAHHDLDLTKPSDVALLESRLADAARSICRRPSYASEPIVNHRACVTDTLARARPMADQLIAEAQPEMASLDRG